ncbi:unnamed protein product, partial [Amoebophrya sp. A25]
EERYEEARVEQEGDIFFEELLRPMIERDLQQILQRLREIAVRGSFPGGTISATVQHLLNGAGAGTITSGGPGASPPLSSASASPCPRPALEAAHLRVLFSMLIQAEVAPPARGDKTRLFYPEHDFDADNEEQNSSIRQYGGRATSRGGTTP